MITENDDNGNRIVFRKFLGFLLGSLLISGLILLYVYFNITGANDKLALLRLEQVKQNLEKEQKEIRINIEYLSSPEQIEKIVKTRFGMRPVTGDRVYVIRSRVRPNEMK